MRTPTQQKRRALIVEDDPMNARLAQLLIEHRGWCVTLAVDGREGVDRVRQTRFDLVLLDWHTPRLDGLSAAREIRSAEAPGDHLPLVALTAISTDHARAQCIAAGMDDFLAKPIARAALDVVLGHVMNGSYGADQAPPRAETPRACVDLTFLTSFGEATDGGAHVGAELGRLFVASCAKRMCDLRRAVSLRDTREAYLALHSLRGICAQVGANAIAALLVEVEAFAKVWALDEVVARLDRLEREVAAVLEEIGTWLATREGA